MATKKSGGSTTNGRDSNPKMRGIKLYDGQITNPGQIIVRQKGTRFHAGKNVLMGRDFTLYAACAGTIKFGHYSRSKKNVSVVTSEI